MAKQKILVAATQHGHDLARRALSKKYDLFFASTMAEAERLLKESEITDPERIRADPEQRHSTFDLVICSVHFDDSRMFELLQRIRNVDHYDKLPFLVITAMPTALPMDTAVKTASELLGAYGFLQLHLLPKEDASKALLKFVEQGFGKTVEAKRLDKNAPKEE